MTLFSLCVSRCCSNNIPIVSAYAPRAIFFFSNFTLKSLMKEISLFFLSLRHSFLSPEKKSIVTDFGAVLNDKTEKRERREETGKNTSFLA
jgi:hypothetical protein